MLLHGTDAAQAEETALQNIIGQQQQEIERCGHDERDACPGARSACAVRRLPILCNGTQTEPHELESTRSEAPGQKLRENVERVCACSLKKHLDEQSQVSVSVYRQVVT
jgi:hypothetical protein